MASLRRRISPKQDAIEHAAKGLDKTAKLELKYINSFKGRGVFTTACFSKGDFVVEYRGEFIDPDEAQRRRTIYHGSCGVFMFDFQWHEKTWCIDAALEDRSLGRLVNDDHKQPNCKMKKILAERKPHLCLFALRDINAGEEITYDYGGVNWPWREQDGAPLTETDASKNETLETSEQTLQGPADFQIEDGAPLTETDASKNETLETSEQTLQGPADFQIEDGAPLTETDASKNETLETSEQTLQGPADFQIEDGAPLTETDASKNETLETSEQTLQGPADFQIEDGAPLTETDASKNETLETSEQTLQGPADFQIEDGAPLTETDASKNETLETSEQTLQGPADFQIEDGAPLTETDASKNETLETSEQTLQGPADFQIEDGAPLTETDASKNETLETSEQTLQGPADFQIEDGAPLTETDASKNETLETSEQTLQGPADFQIEDGAPLTETDASKNETLETSEQTLQGPADFQIEDGAPLTETDASKNETLETSEQTLQGPADFQIEGSDATGPLPSVERVSLVDYTHSDVSLGPSMSPDSEQDDFPIPRLRRTKSILMKDQTSFDSDELFDPTSDDSGEEYIPGTSEDSDGTDTSQILDINDHREVVIDNLNLLNAYDIRDSYSSPPEANVSSQQDRGRSPTRKKRHQRQRLVSASCPITPSSHGHSSQQRDVGDTSDLFKNSMLPPDQSLPDSTSSSLTYGVSDGSLSIPATCKKENGSRIYNKKQYCLYCKLGVVKLARHLERAHPLQPEVAQAMAFPKCSKERKMHLEHLRNRGNFAHNVEVMNSGVGSLVPRKQPRQDSKAGDFLHCPYCQGFFARELLWRHMKICKFRPQAPHKQLGKTRVQALCAFSVPPPPGVKHDLWKLLNNMMQDEVCTAVKSDPCILEYGDHLYNRLGYDPVKHEYIRQKLRELGRLLISSRKNTSMKTIRDHIRPANFMQVVEAVKQVAGYDSEAGAYKTPSLALKIGHSLTKIALLVESRANLHNNHSAAKEARTFRRVYDTRWNEMISAASLRTLQESRWNTPLLLPFVEDVQTLHSYLDEQHQQTHTKLSTETSPRLWSQVAKITLTQVILFNRRRAGEVSKMPLCAFLSNNPCDPQEDLNEALSAVEKKLCQHFRRVEIRGKRGRKVPVLLTPAMQKALDLLVLKRQDCGVPQGNKYLFGRPHTFTCYRGSDCLRHFAKVCGAKRPESLTSTRLRKQTGTLSQVLNLTNTELDQLADFMGHDIRVHRQFYRLPEGTLQLAKISKVLIALEKGRLAEFKGKTLDEIHIDPKENLYPDSDAEEACEPDSPESQATTSQSQKSDGHLSDSSPLPTPLQQSTMVPHHTQHPPQSPTRQRARQPLKKRVWEKEEVLAVERHMMSFITMCRVPGKKDCEKCLQQERIALRHRNWLGIKFYIKNRITALKRKV